MSCTQTLSRFFHGARKPILVPSGEIWAPAASGAPKKSSIAIRSCAMVMWSFREAGG